MIEEDVSGMKWLSEKLGDAEVSRLISEEENYDGDHVVFTFKLMNSCVKKSIKSGKRGSMPCEINQSAMCIFAYGLYFR